MASVKQLLLEWKSQSEEIDRDFDEVAARLKTLDGEEARTTVELQLAHFREQAVQAVAILDAIDKKKVSPEVKLKASNLRAALLSMLKDADNVEFSPKLRIGGKFSDNDGLRKLFSGLAGDAEGLTGALGDVEKGSKAAEQGTTVLGLSVARIVPILAGLAIIVGVVLVSALAAMAASLAAAVGGVVALAAAFVAALGPAIILIATIMSRIGAIMDAYKARQNAQTDAAKQGAKAAGTLAAAHEQELAALNGVRDATQAVTTAKRELAQAQAAARKELRDATRAVEDDERSVRRALGDEKRAQGELRQARLDAIKDWADALEKVSDKQRDLKHANVDLAKATLDLGDAQKEWNNAINGIPEDKVTTLLQKLSDVSLDPSQVPAAAASALGDSGGGVDPNRVAKAWVNLQNAQLGVEDATDAVSDANRDLKRAQDDVAMGQEAFIKRAPGVVSANDTIRNSEERLADARRRLARDRQTLSALEDQGISQAPRVIGAAEGVRDAEERLATAKHQLAIAGVAAAGGIGKVSDAAATAEAKFGRLTKAEQRFLVAIEGLVTTARSVMAPAMNAVFGAMVGGIRLASKTLRQNKGLFTALGGAMAAGIRALVKEFGNPAWQGFFKAMTRLSTQIIGLLTPGVIALARVFRDIALQSGPQLTKVLGLVVGWLGSFAKATGNARGLHGIIELLVDSLVTWLKFGGAISRVFLTFLTIAAPLGNQLVEWLTRGANALASWMNSEEGRKRIQQFFEATLPIAEQMIPLLLKFGLIFLQLLELMAPFLVGLLKALNGLADALSWLMEKLILLARPFGGIIEAVGFLTGMFLGGEGLGAAFKLIGRLAGWVGGKFAAIADASGAVGRATGEFFSKAAGLGRSVISGIGSVLKGIGKALVDWFRNGWNKILDFFGVHSPSTRAKELGRAIIQGLVNGIKSYAGLLASIGRWIFNKIKSGLSSFAGGALQIGKDIAGSIANGVTSVASFGGVGSSILGTVQGSINAQGWEQLGVGPGQRIGGGIAGAANGAGGAIVNGINGALSTGSVKAGVDAINSAINKLIGTQKYKPINITVQSVSGGARKALTAVRRAVAVTRAAAKRVIWIKAQTITGAALNALNKINHAMDEVLKKAGQVGGWKGLKALSASVNTAIDLTQLDRMIVQAFGQTAVSQLQGALAGKPVKGAAAGGVFRVPTFRTLGDGREPEAAVPLNSSVLGQIGRGIAATMPSPVAVAAGGGAGGGVNIEHQEIKLETPGGGMPDERTAAHLIAEHLRKKGGARRGGRR